MAHYDKQANLSVTHFLDLEDNQTIKDREFKIHNLKMRGTIWDLSFRETGLCILRKYNQQYYEFFDLQSRKLEVRSLMLERVKDTDNINFDENLVD